MGDPTTKRSRLRLAQGTERDIDVPSLQCDAIESRQGTRRLVWIIGA